MIGLLGLSGLSGLWRLQLLYSKIRYCLLFASRWCVKVTVLTICFAVVRESNGATYDTTFCSELLQVSHEY